MSRLGKLSFIFSAFSLLCMVLVRYMVGDWVPFCWIALGLFIFFLIFGFVMDRKFFGEFFMMKTTKHGMNMGVLILLVVTSLVIVNFLAVRHYAVWDFSLSKTNTLSPQSVQLLKGLDSEMKIIFFYKKGVEGNEENRRMFRDLVKKYQDQSPHVQLDFVEVNERPDMASDFGVDKGSGVVFLVYKGHRNRIDKIDEQEMSSALVKVTRDKKKTIYFTSGHGENSLDEAREAEGFNALKLLLESNSYIVKSLALNQTPKIPLDADMVIIGGPSQAFQDFEITGLEDYLKHGGSLLMGLYPRQSEGLEKIVSKLGLQIQNNYVWSVVDTTLGRGINQGPVMGSTFSQLSDITKAFGKDEVTLFLHPTAINRLDNPPQSVAIDDLVRTNGSAIAYKTLEIKGDGAQGPFTLVNSVKGKYPGADTQAKDFTLVVAGDADFMDNQLLFKNLNRDLVLNTVASLVKEENLISISPKEPQKTEMNLTQMKFTLFIFGFIIPIPLLMLGASVGLWLKRRNA